MTVETFEKRVWGFARAHGVPFISRTDAADFREFVSEKVQDFVAQTRILYDDNVTFTLSSSDTGYYELLDETIFSRPVLEPEVIFIDGNPLTDSDGLPGLVTVGEANDWVANYRSVTDATPQKAFVIQKGDSQVLRLMPAPDATYAGVIAGWVQHFSLTPESVDDSTEMVIPRAARQACIKYVAGELILIGAEGPSQQAAAALSQLGISEGQKHSVKAGSYLAQDTRGRLKNRVYSLT